MSAEFNPEDLDIEMEEPLTGYVDEYIMDDGFKGFMLFTEDEDELFVIPDHAGRLLHGFVDKRIAVTDFVTVAAAGDNYILIRKFKVAEHEDDQSEYDFDLQFLYDLERSL